MILLSPVQTNVLAFIREFVTENGYAPTRREIADRFDWDSATSANDVLWALHHKKHIVLTPGKSRAIRILE